MKRLFQHLLPTVGVIALGAAVVAQAAVATDWKDWTLVFFQLVGLTCIILLDGGKYDKR